MTDNSINQAFEAQCQEEIARQGDDQKLTGLAREFFNESAKHKYSYHFSWMGRPIIQLPQDMMAMQEIIWQVKPDLVIECGIAHGGSIIYYASLLELQGHGEVLGIDLDIRPHNREAIESHPMAKRIKMIEPPWAMPHSMTRSGLTCQMISCIAIMSCGSWMIGRPIHEKW